MQPRRRQFPLNRTNGRIIGCTDENLLTLTYGIRALRLQMENIQNMCRPQMEIAHMQHIWTVWETLQQRILEIHGTIVNAPVNAQEPETLSLVVNEDEQQPQVPSVSQMLESAHISDGEPRNLPPNSSSRQSNGVANSNPMLVEATNVSDSTRMSDDGESAPKRPRMTAPNDVSHNRPLESVRGTSKHSTEGDVVRVIPENIDQAKQQMDTDRFSQGFSENERGLAAKKETLQRTAMVTSEHTSKSKTEEMYSISNVRGNMVLGEPAGDNSAGFSRVTSNDIIADIEVDQVPSQATPQRASTGEHIASSSTMENYSPADRKNGDNVVCEDKVSSDMESYSSQYNIQNENMHSKKQTSQGYRELLEKPNEIKASPCGSNHIRNLNINSKCISIGEQSSLITDSSASGMEDHVKSNSVTEKQSVAEAIQTVSVLGETKTTVCVPDGNTDQITSHIAACNQNESIEQINSADRFTPSSENPSAVATNENDRNDREISGSTVSLSQDTFHQDSQTSQNLLQTCDRATQYEEIQDHILKPYVSNEREVDICVSNGNSDTVQVASQIISHSEELSHQNGPVSQMITAETFTPTSTYTCDVKINMNDRNVQDISATSVSPSQDILGQCAETAKNIIQTWNRATQYEEIPHDAPTPLNPRPANITRPVLFQASSLQSPRVLHVGGRYYMPRPRFQSHALQSARGRGRGSLSHPASSAEQLRKPWFLHSLSSTNNKSVGRKKSQIERRRDRDKKFADPLGGNLGMPFQRPGVDYLAGLRHRINSTCVDCAENGWPCFRCALPVNRNCNISPVNLTRQAAQPALQMSSSSEGDSTAVGIVSRATNGVSDNVESDEQKPSTSGTLVKSGVSNLVPEIKEKTGTEAQINSPQFGNLDGSENSNEVPTVSHISQGSASQNSGALQLEPHGSSAVESLNMRNDNLASTQNTENKNVQSTSMAECTASTSSDIKTCINENCVQLKVLKEQRSTESNSATSKASTTCGTENDTQNATNLTAHQYNIRSRAAHATVQRVAGRSTHSANVRSTRVRMPPRVTPEVERIRELFRRLHRLVDHEQTFRAEVRDAVRNTSGREVLREWLHPNYSMLRDTFTEDGVRNYTGEIASIASSRLIHEIQNQIHNTELMFISARAARGRPGNEVAREMNGARRRSSDVMSLLVDCLAQVLDAHRVLHNLPNGFQDNTLYAYMSDLYFLLQLSTELVDLLNVQLNASGLMTRIIQGENVDHPYLPSNYQRNPSATHVIRGAPFRVRTCQENSTHRSRGPTSMQASEVSTTPPPPPPPPPTPPPPPRTTCHTGGRMLGRSSAVQRYLRPPYRILTLRGNALTFTSARTQECEESPEIQDGHGDSERGNMMSRPSHLSTLDRGSPRTPQKRFSSTNSANQNGADNLCSQPAQPLHQKCTLKVQQQQQQQQHNVQKQEQNNGERQSLQQNVSRQVREAQQPITCQQQIPHSPQLRPRLRLPPPRPPPLATPRSIPLRLSARSETIVLGTLMERVFELEHGNTQLRGQAQRQQQERQEQHSPAGASELQARNFSSVGEQQSQCPSVFNEAHGNTQLQRQPQIQQHERQEQHSPAGVSEFQARNSSSVGEQQFQRPSDTFTVPAVQLNDVPIADFGILNQINPPYMRPRSPPAVPLGVLCRHRHQVLRQLPTAEQLPDRHDGTHVSNRPQPEQPHVPVLGPDQPLHRQVRDRAFSSHAVANRSNLNDLPSIEFLAPLVRPPYIPYPGNWNTAGGPAGFRSRFLHPRYVGPNMFNEEPFSSMENISFLRGHGTVIMTDSPMTPNHRIQAWDVSKFQVPDISNADKNIVVPECKIHNDANVDISKDGSLLVTLLPSNRICVTTTIGVYSLEWESLGQCLYTTTFEQSAVSVSLSPACRHLLVGLSSRRIVLPSDRPTIAQIFRMEGAIPGRNMGGRGRLRHLRDIEQTRQNIFTSLNCIRWAPEPGQGLVYGTNTGHLRVLR